MHEALHYSKLKDNRVKCRICPNNCIIDDQKRGICMGRLNKAGTLIAENYGQIVTASVDPVEKKPLYHFYPSELILSISTYGCSFSCQFCQNSQLSQHILGAEYMDPADIVELTLRKNSFGIAYTYSEPLVWYEYVLDCARLAKEKGLKNVLVSNGYINEEPLQELMKYIDAVNIDIKSFRDAFYREYCNGKLEPVLASAKAFYKNKVHIEITNLVIPALNDTEQEIRDLANFIHDEMGKEVPLHFSRYFPNYRMNIEPTPLSTLEMAYSIAREKLDYVYIGNIHSSDEYNSTYCPSCNNLLISRACYSARKTGLTKGRCSKCGEIINVIG